MTLRVDGTDVKETAPPTSGEELGFFYFDLLENSGGFSGESGRHEFFDACVRNKSDANVASVPQHDVAEAPTVNPGSKKQAIEAPATTIEEPSPPQTPRQILGHDTTEYYGGKESRAKSALPTKATMNPDYKKEEDRTATTPTAAKEPPPTPTFGQGTTEYFGGGYSSPPAWSTEAPANLGSDKSKTPTAASSTTSPSAVPVREAALETCADALTLEARTAKFYFGNSSSDIEPSSRAELRKIGKIVKDCGNLLVEVAGHTDNLGNATNNKTLSQLRAKAVVDFLVGEGVKSSNLKAVGYGQEKPIAANTTVEGRRLNRRVEFRVSGH
jgi:outer membrane protein OmpA-like peptidoglycan-associated protein